MTTQHTPHSIAGHIASTLSKGGAPLSNMQSVMLVGALHVWLDEYAKQKPCRHELQETGSHPAPCAKFCESKAYEIELRTARRQHDELLAALDRVATCNIPGGTMTDHLLMCRQVAKEAIAKVRGVQP